MTRRISVFAIVLAVVASATAGLQAAPVFFLSTEAAPSGPSMLNGSADANMAGVLNIFANSDVRLSGVSLDLMEMGGGVRFTGVDIPNPNSRWAFAENPVVTDSLISSIGAAAIPGLVGGGIGAGSPDTGNVLLASVNFMSNGDGTSSLFALKVGGNTIADWDGNSPTVHFGTAASTGVPGGVPGGSGPAGLLEVGEIVGGDAPVAVDLDLGERIQGAIISHIFTTSAGTPPITWGDLQIVGPAPATAPTFTADGNFSWNSHGSPFGSYTFNLTAENSVGTDTGSLMVELVVPEPATMTLFGLAMIGLVGFARRRS